MDFYLLRINSLLSSADGRLQKMWQSILPGQSRAGSIMSGLDVAATTNVYLSSVTPSSETKKVFTIRSVTEVVL